jgi:hypothetical protein
LITGIVLLKSLLLKNFPSGSAINYYNGKLYLIGDDANNMLVLNTDYQEIDSIQLFDYPIKRIPKAEKTDFETAVLVNVKDKMHLLILGSASTKEREKGILISLEGLPVPQTFSYAEFMKRVKMKEIAEINIEGATLIRDHFILSNRGNSVNQKNHLIITEKDFWIRQNEAALSVLEIVMPFNIKETPGVSELCYVESNDLLLFTMSSEATNNAYDDGVIGDSYIGWVNHISRKLQQPGIMLDGLINLSEINTDFKGEKIEGICIGSASDNELILHLIADNDQGESRLFNVKMMLGTVLLHV